jgi:hypothetical protein
MVSTRVPSRSNPTATLWRLVIVCLADAPKPVEDLLATCLRKRRNSLTVTLMANVGDLPVATSSAVNRVVVPWRTWSWVRDSGSPGPQRQDRRRLVQGLDLRLLVF